MGRNKDIKALHAITGKSYKECRAMMKANKWDLYKAVGLDCLPQLPEIIKNTIEVMREAAQLAADTLLEFGRQLHEIIEEQQNKIDSL